VPTIVTGNVSNPGTEPQIALCYQCHGCHLFKASNQPKPSGALPSGLKKALYTFFVGAAAKVIGRPTENFAFLCHVSMGTKDHEYTRQLLDDFKGDAISAFKNKSSGKYAAMEKGLREAYDDLSKTDQSLPPFADISAKIERYIPGSNIKLINAISNDEIKLDSVFNIFVGGNKLGRGVTIKNLLVSYYGRNPKLHELTRCFSTLECTAIATRIWA